MINVYFSELPKTLTEILGLKYDETMSYEERVQKRYDYIKEQLKLNPYYEGWDYLENVKGGDKFEHLISFAYLISTKGRLLSSFIRSGQYKTLGCHKDGHGYRVQILIIEQKRYKCSIHRVVGCTFVPKTTTYRENINYLVVNHKDINKLNNHFTNLEWCTNLENIKHAVENSEVNKVYFNSIFEATVLIDCKYKGYKFKVFGASGLHEIGLDGNALSCFFNNNANTAVGCSWKYITQEEADKLPLVPDFIKDKFINDRVYMNLRVKPYKATVVKDCKYKGLTFTLYGALETKKNRFHQSPIRISIETGAVRYGCVWERVTREDAECFQRGITEKQLAVIRSKHI